MEFSMASFLEDGESEHAQISHAMVGQNVISELRETLRIQAMRPIKTKCPSPTIATELQGLFDEYT